MQPKTSKPLVFKYRVSAGTPKLANMIAALAGLITIFSSNLFGVEDIPSMINEQPPQSPTQALPQKVIKNFNRDGVVKLEDIFAPFEGEMNKMIDIIDNSPPLQCRYLSFMYHFIVHKTKNLTNFGKQMNMMCPDASYTFQEVEDMIFKSPIGSIAAQLLNTSTVRLEHAPVMRSDGTAPTPWHADNAGAFLTNGTGLVVYVPFEQSTANTDGLKFIAGSHKFPSTRDPPSFCNETIPDSFCVEEIGRRQEEDPRKHVLTYDLKVGDALFFDKNTMHASTGYNMKTRHNLQIRLIAGEDSFYKNIKGASYGNPYSMHEKPANNNFMFPQIYPNFLADEYAQRVAYKRSGITLKYLFDMARISIESFFHMKEIRGYCPEEKCFQS